MKKKKHKNEWLVRVLIYEAATGQADQFYRK